MPWSEEDVLKLLRANLPLERSTIVPCALSDTDGEVWFQTNKANKGAGRIVAAGGQDAIRIQTQSADRLFAHASISRIDLVKIDAEGHEKTVVQNRVFRISIGCILVRYCLRLSP